LAYIFVADNMGLSSFLPLKIPKK